MEIFLGDSMQEVERRVAFAQSVAFNNSLPDYILNVQFRLNRKAENLRKLRQGHPFLISMCAHTELLHRRKHKKYFKTCLMWTFPF